MAGKILIVDDDQYFRELYEEVLKDEGYEVETAPDGQVALDKIQKGNYDLMLLDVMMPHLDGLGLVEKLSEVPPTVKRPIIIFLTNLSNDPAIKAALAKGAQGYLVKADVTPNKVADEVKKLLTP